MAVAFVSVNGTAVTSATSVTPAMPAGIVAGNLLISECLIKAEKTASISAGWTIIHQQVQANMSLATAVRVATESGDQPTWSWTGNSNANGNVSRLTGAYNGDPIGNESIAGGVGTTAATAAIVATAASSFMFSQTNALNNQTVPLPSGYTSDSEFHSVNGSERMSHKNTTDVGDSSGSNSVTITSTTWASSLIEIRSEAPPPPAALDRFRATIIW